MALDSLKPRPSFGTFSAESWQVMAVVALVAITVPGLALVGAWRIWADYRVLHRYVPVQARVTATRIDVATEEVRKKDSSDTQKRTVYRPQGDYQFEAAGRSWTGLLWAEEDVQSWSERANAEAELAAFPVGASVQVRYEPDEPSQSVRRDGYRGLNFLFFFLFGGLSVGLAWWYRRLRADG